MTEFCFERLDEVKNLINRLMIPHADNLHIMIDTIWKDGELYYLVKVG